MSSDDFIVMSKSNDDLERLARGVLSQTGASFTKRNCPFSMAKALAITSGRLRGLEIVEQTNAAMGLSDAYTTHGDTKRIFAKSSVFQGAVNGDGRSRFTLFHEIAHAYLHEGPAMNRMSLVRDMPAYVKPFESAEHQANYSASSLMMPEEMVIECKEAETLAFRACASPAAARNRIDALRHKLLVPRLPLRSIAYMNGGGKQSARLPNNLGSDDDALFAEIDSAWEKLQEAAGHSKNTHRLARDGYLIARRDYKANSACGWDYVLGEIRSTYCR